MTTLLDIRDLGVDVTTDQLPHPILTVVDLTVQAGETVGLVGESGSGKSMTARSVIGLLPKGTVARGQIVFEGRDLLTLRPRELDRIRAHDIAMVFQDARSHLNPVRTIADYMSEVLVWIDGMDRRAAVSLAALALAETGISDAERVLACFPHQLSGGMLQRVMIAAAVLRRPKLLLADEPTTALDVTIQSEVMALLKDLSVKHQMAMLLITHDIELAAAVCSRIAVMYAGSIVEIAPAERIIASPSHPYTRALLDSRPDIRRRHTPLPAIPGRPPTALETRTGCAFAPRCLHAIQSCGVVSPPLVARDGAMVRCIRADDLQPVLARVDR